MRNFALILAVFVLFFGCIGEWKTLAEPEGGNESGAAKEAGPAEKIGYLYVEQEYGSYYYDENDSYNVSFTLEDANGNVVTAPGTLNLDITDTNNVTLYRGQAAVSEDGFVKSPDYPYYGNKAYAYGIDFGAINKSGAYYANVTAVFKTNDGKTFRKSRQVYLSSSLQNYSSYDYGYGVELDPINASVTSENLKVTIVEGGVTGSSYYSYYTAKVSFTNTGSAKREVTLTDAALVSGGQQYALSSYYDKEELGDIYPGASVTKEFEFTNDDYEVSEDALGTDATLYLTLQVWDTNGSGKTLDIQVPFKP
jgi:hypothetical protein